MLFLLKVHNYYFDCGRKDLMEKIPAIDTVCNHCTFSDFCSFFSSCNNECNDCISRCCMCTADCIDCYRDCMNRKTRYDPLPLD